MADEEKVFIAVDGGPASAAALGWVIERSHRVSMVLEIVTVVDSAWSYLGGVDEDFRPHYETVLAGAERRIREQAPHLPHSTSVLKGSRTHELVRASKDADLLVIGTNKAPRSVGFVYGTLALRLAASAECPVVVVSTSWTPSRGPVVVGVGDIDRAPAVLERAIAEATGAGRDLRIVHAWNLPVMIEAEALDSAPIRKSLAEGSERILAAAAARVRTRYPELRVEQRLVENDVARALVTAAEDASLLVVGRHGHGSIEGMLLGSESHDVLLTMPCPVMVVPSLHQPAPRP